MVTSSSRFTQGRVHRGFRHAGRGPSPRRGYPARPAAAAVTRGAAPAHGHVGATKTAPRCTAKTPEARHEHPGRCTSGRHIAVVLPPDTGPHARPDRGPRSRHRPSLPNRQILLLADRAYPGAGATFRTPYYHHHEQPQQYQQCNRDHARLRALGNFCTQYCYERSRGRLAAVR